MKKLFVTLFLIGMAMVVYSQDYYWYRGNKIPLEKGCRKYIIYEDDKLNESDKSHITHSEDVFYDEIPNLKWGRTTAHAIIEDTAHVHYSTISYRKDGDYYDNMFVTHRFYVKLKNQEDSLRLQELAERYSAEIVHQAGIVNEEGVFPAWYILRCKLDAPKNALELANLFYETTDLFSATEPEMINIFLPEFPKAIKTLCDEWNVWHESFESFGPISFDKVVKYQLTTDTLINGQHYVKLTSDKDSPYVGAMREGNNRDIYYVPEGSTNEFLLYAFNAQVGEVLNDLYLGGFEENGYSGRVEAISDSSPRLFTIRVLYPDGMGVEPGESFSVTWIEGVGSPETPYGLAVVPTVPDIGVYSLLCAYKNGKQVYVSDMGEQYGCEHDLTPEPTDTIPLFSYAGDDPGSSTVDPVDPNQVVVTLRGHELIIRVFFNVDVTYTLRHYELAKMPARSHTSTSDTFRDEITLQITESGEYLLLLTNPSWGYSIYGTFFYAPQGIEQISSSSQGGKTSRLVLVNGQIFILRGEKVYTLQGQVVR